MNYLFFPAKQGHEPRTGPSTDLGPTLDAIDNKALSARTTTTGDVEEGLREWANGPHKAKIAENTQTAGAGRL